MHCRDLRKTFNKFCRVRNKILMSKIRQIWKKVCRFNAVLKLEIWGKLLINFAEFEIRYLWVKLGIINMKDFYGKVCLQF